MKKRIFISILVVFIGLAFIISSPIQAEAKTYKLTYSNFFPPFHIQSKLAESWCKEVEKRTNGKVKVEYFPKGTLTKAKQCYDGVVTGISDVGLSIFAYTRGRFPVMAAVDLPLGYNSGKVATAVANDFVRKFRPKELSDVEVMYVHAHGPGLVHTVEGKPVKKLKDMKGLKLRGHGTSALFQKALGATPFHHDPVGGQSLGLGQLDVVAARNLEHGIAHDQHRCGQVVEGGGNRRQHQMVQEIRTNQHT